MSKYFSIDAIMAAFSLLNTELSAGTHFSALQYMFALDNYAHKFGRDCDTDSDEGTFVSFAHKVGGLEDGEVPDHIDGFTGKSRKRTKILPESIQISLAQELFNVPSAQPAKTPSFTPAGQKAIFLLSPRRCFLLIQFVMSIWTPIFHQRK